jgi:hypothetical protein
MSRHPVDSPDNSSQGSECVIDTLQLDVDSTNNECVVDILQLEVTSIIITNKCALEVTIRLSP